MYGNTCSTIDQYSGTNLKCLFNVAFFSGSFRTISCTALMESCVGITSSRSTLRTDRASASLRVAPYCKRNVRRHHLESLNATKGPCVSITSSLKRQVSFTLVSRHERLEISATISDTPEDFDTPWKVERNLAFSMWVQLIILKFGNHEC